MKGVGTHRGWRAGAAPQNLARAAAALGVVVVLASGCSSSPVEQSQPAEKTELNIWLTGYSWQDNTPPGSSKVGEPVLHKVAAGNGTFADPITVATPGHKGDQEWKPGTKFYLPTVQRYVIVEDSGAAKAPEGTDTHLDMWIGGEGGTKQATDDCMNKFTGKVPAQVNPPDGLPVMAGPIYGGNKCNIPAQPDNLGTYSDPGDDSGSSNGDDNSGSDDSGNSNSNSNDSGGNGDDSGNSDNGGSHHRHGHGHHDDDSDH